MTSPRLTQHFRNIVILPVNAAVIIPTLILYLTGGFHIRWALDLSALVLPWSVSLVLLAIGFTLFIWTVRLFHSVGEGTLAPWEPTQKLVVEGPYRHVRNPMISSVMMILLAETTIWGAASLLTWLLFFFFANTVYFLLSEEPGLEKRFGESYRNYKKHVPRWVPRITAWNPD